jgi:hypothetical protein
MGLIVLRIRNSEFDDIANVLEKIWNYFQLSPPFGHPSLLREAGGE